MQQPNPQEKSAQNKILVLCGPTASGKSSLALELAVLHDAQIINADSTQVYRQMDVGTDKVSAADRERVVHHLIDLVDPDEDYTAADYVRDARTVIAELLEQGVLPIVVGGTGFYVRALLEGLFPQPPIDKEIRSALDQQADEDLPALYARLQSVDPSAAANIEAPDRFRVVRALEVFEITGRPISEHWADHKQRVATTPHPRTPTEAIGAPDMPVPYDTLKLGVSRPREVLYEAINERATHQIYDGHLRAEVEALLARYPPTLHPFKALTYRHMIQVLNGTWTPEEAYDVLSRDTRRYAKRQLTWFRKDADIEWFDFPDQHGALLQRVKTFLG